MCIYWFRIDRVKVWKAMQFRVVNNLKVEMNIKHIGMPFDELQLFKDEDRYQSYLVETLIYSTKVSLHSNTRKIKCVMVITKNHLWLEDDTNRKKKLSVPLKAIAEILKAEEHPQLVLLTEDGYDNLRISTASEQRALNIISAIAFYFTYLSQNKRPVKVCTIKQNSLLYFERTVKQKRNGPKINLDRYNKNLVFYVQSKDSPDIYGKLIIHKMVFNKQLYVEGPYLIHLAQINEKEHYLVHTLNREQTLIQALTHHQSIQHVQKLVYAKKLQYKMQLFFQYLPSLKLKSIKMTDLFEQLYQLYQVVKKENKNGFITPQMLLRSAQHSKQLVLRQYRYPQLLLDYEQSAFLYRKVHKQTSHEDYLLNKMFNIGMILYYYLFGRVLFEHDDPQFILYLKENIKQVPFPKAIKVAYSQKIQHFIESCILGKFKSINDIRTHPWIETNKIDI